MLDPKVLDYEAVARAKEPGWPDKVHPLALHFLTEREPTKKAYQKLHKVVADTYMFLNAKSRLNRNYNPPNMVPNSYEALKATNKLLQQEYENLIGPTDSQGNPTEGSGSLETVKEYFLGALAGLVSLYKIHSEQTAPQR